MFSQIYSRLLVIHFLKKFYVQSFNFSMKSVVSMWRNYNQDAYKIALVSSGGEKSSNNQVFKKVFKMTHQEFNCDGPNSRLSQLWRLFHRLVCDYFCKKQNENSECADLWRYMLITENALICYSYLMRLPRAQWTWGIGWNVSTDYLPNINLIIQWLN